MRHINVNNQMKNSFEYDENPASFSRGTIVENVIINSVGIASSNKTLYVSGTASIGENGETLHIDDFDKQLAQTYKNITSVLKEADCDWLDVARTTVYLRDIDRDYEKLNKGRKKFFDSVGIKEYPASTCIEAKLCRSNLLCEIEVIAVKLSLGNSK